MKSLSCHMYHGYWISILAGEFNVNAIVSDHTGRHLRTIPAVDEHTASRAAKYFIRRWERGRKPKESADA